MSKDDEWPGSERSAAGAAALYQIRVKGRLAPGWASWFAGMAITFAAGGDTLLTGEVADQAALHGLLKKVRDLGLPLATLGGLVVSPACGLAGLTPEGARDVQRVCVETARELTERATD